MRGLELVEMSADKTLSRDASTRLLRTSLSCITRQRNSTPLYLIAPMLLGSWAAVIMPPGERQKSALSPCES